MRLVLLLVSVTDVETRARYYARFAEMFFQFCDKELQKINTFFSGKSLMGKLCTDIQTVKNTILLLLHYLLKNCR